MYLEVKDLKKSYGEGGSYVEVLKGVELENESQVCPAVIRQFLR